MTESFRFRTRSGREILLVPAHTVDFTAYAATLDGTIVEHRPIPALARIELELSGLQSPVPETPA